jgi:dihydroxy-acid dehydratase
LSADRFDRDRENHAGAREYQAAGTKYLMEDFYYAGGLRALLRELGERLKLDCLTINRQNARREIGDAKIYNDDVIRTRDKALSETGGLAVLRGNLAPNGAIIKPTAAEPHLLKHTGSRSSVRGLQRHERAHRRRIARSRREVGARAEERRAARRTWHARMGPASHPEEAAEERYPGHGAHFGCAHERDVVRHLRAARFTRVYIGGPLAFVRDGDLIELDVRCAQARAESERCRARQTQVGMESAAAAFTAAMAHSSQSTSRRPTKVAISIFCMAARRRRIRKYH